MPIYAYKCASCGHAKDVLRRMSDDPLTICPSCGEATFEKQVTAAGFQLKGSGWYVTDFRGGNTAAAEPASKSGESAAPASKSDATPATASTGASAPSPAPAPASAPATSSATKPSTPST